MRGMTKAYEAVHKQNMAGQAMTFCALPQSMIYKQHAVTEYSHALGSRADGQEDQKIVSFSRFVCTV